MNTFETTGLRPEIVKAVTTLGFKAPTPIQKKAIPFLLENEEDLIALAQTGTGKTAAFGLPLIEGMDPHLRTVQALVLCPTRELCLQIAADLADYARFMPRINIVPVYGGANINNQIRDLARNPQIVIGTPGRTLDLIQRGDLLVNDLRTLVLDEADEMLDRGFKHDLDAILRGMPRDKRTLLFSATMPDEIARIARNYLHKPQKIAVGKQNSGAENVSHAYYLAEKRGRYKFLRDLLRTLPGMYGIVFCRTKRKVREVARRLTRDGFSAVPLQGDMSQQQRDKAMRQFKSKRVKLLIATDVAARGVDIDELTHVINFNLPDEDAVYIHRSGRTGRAGRSGVSLSILDVEEQSRIRGLEKLARKPFERLSLELNGTAKAPEPEKRESVHEEEEDNAFTRDPFARKLMHWVDDILMSTPKDPDLDSYLPMVNAYLEDHDKEDLIRRFMAYISNNQKHMGKEGVKGKATGGKSGKKFYRKKKRGRGGRR